MHTIRQGNKIIVQDNNFVVSKTLECGQIFRYFKNGEEDYFVCSTDKRCRVTGCDGKIEIITDDPDYFYNFFDLNFDYQRIFDKLSAFPELSEALDCGRGIRILRQDLYETIISFIISANNNILRIKGIIERLCSEYGKNCGDYFAFPTPSDFKETTVSDFRRLGCGFRDRYLYEACMKLRDENILESLRKAETEDARKILYSFKGIGPKVADCIILFGLGRFDTYPVDTWIFKACKTEELDTPSKVMRYFLDRYGEYAGYAQQLIFFKQRQTG